MAESDCGHQQKQGVRKRKISDDIASGFVKRTFRRKLRHAMPETITVQEGKQMIFKVAIPGKVQFKIIKKEPNFFMTKQGDIHYIGGTEVLPPPLEVEKENEVIHDLGTEYEDEAKSILIEHNLRLVVYIAKKFDNTGVGVEDLISIGTIGLIKSINTFNPEKNIKLATYASRCIENEILMYLRKGSFC